MATFQIYLASVSPRRRELLRQIGVAYRLLPITVDEEGFLIARADFDQPVGPSFWERER